MIFKETSLSNGDFFIRDTVKDFANKLFLNEPKQKSSQEVYDKYIIAHYKQNKGHCKFTILKTL